MAGHFKTLHNFSVSTDDFPQVGEIRAFAVSGDVGAKFSIEVKNEDNYHYNFDTKVFESGYRSLANVVLTSGSYSGHITVPGVTDADEYTISLHVDFASTRHAKHKEVRRADGSYDTNSSTGSNSALLKRIIHQTLDKTITLSSYSPSGMAGSSVTTQALTGTRSLSIPVTPFSITTTAAADKAFQIIKNPSEIDIMTFVSRVVGGTPSTIPGENIYPTVTGTDTVNGDRDDSAVAVTMDNEVAEVMAVGDRVTGNAALNAGNFTVASLDSANVFSLSSAVAIADGATLSFSNQRNHSWPISSTVGIKSGMTVLSDAGSNGFATGTIVKEYIDSTINFKKTAIDNRGQIPTLTTNATTNVTTVTQPGDVTFNNQALLSYAGATTKIFGYGALHLKDMTGYDVVFSDLKISLTPIVTTTTAAVSASTSVPVTSRNGILDSVSVVSGIGIDAGVVNPTVSSGAGAVTGAGTVVLSAAQTLEDGATLTFTSAGQVATITGNVAVNKIGNEDVTIRFDLDKVLSYT
jgi:hypothetical protein